MIDSNLLTIIGIGLAAMFFGYFFGLFEGRGQGYKRRKKEEPAEQPSTPPPPAPAVPPPAVIPATPAVKSLLQLRLDGEKPVLEVDGRGLDIASVDPEQRKRLIDLMLMIRPWVEATSSSKPPLSAQPAAVPVERPAAAPAPSPAVAQPAGSPAAMRAFGAPREAPEPGQPATMVGQIDSILQSRLMGTALEGRGIRVIESAQGGASILVGTTHYAGVGDVPDPDVQAAIKGAIAEWEARYTPT